MSHSVRHHLRLEIDAYDGAIRRWIPGYERMLEEAAAAVAEVAPRRVVDLGAGTGGLTGALLERDEIGGVELLDVDPEMMEQARTRLAGHRDRVRFRLGSFHDTLPDADAMCGSLSLHHIPDMANKRRLYERVYQALGPGGVFVNADATMPADAAAAQPFWRAWADHQIAHGISEDEAYRHFEEWSAEDTYFPLEEELSALTKAGYSAECRWRNGPITVVVARKPE